MVKHIQTIRRQFADNCLSVFDHFMNLALKGLTEILRIEVSFERMSLLSGKLAIIISLSSKALYIASFYIFLRVSFFLVLSI